LADLSGRTIIITGASRGVGRAMALRFARDGASIVVAAKTAEPHPKLEGTITDTALEVEKAGGKALAFQVDVRSEQQVAAMVAAAAERFGGIDALVNNASAISLTGVEGTPVKKYDLMQAVNSRGVFVCSQAVIPHLKRSPCPHILTLSPPLSTDPKWLEHHAPYTLSKFGMTMLSLGMAAELRRYGIAVNCLWPRTIIATAAVEFALADRDAFKYCRKPDILADAAHEILTTQGLALTGRTLTDEEILQARGVTDFTPYAYDKEYAGRLIPDLFL